MTDGHGSTRALVNASGQTVEQYDYDAFGTMTWGRHIDISTQTITSVTADTAATTWLFGGDGFYDPASGFTNHDARWTNGFWLTTADFGGYGSNDEGEKVTLINRGRKGDAHQ